MQHMQPNDKIAFRGRLTKIVSEKKINPIVLSLIPAVAQEGISMVKKFFKERQKWMPPNTEIDNFVNNLVKEHSFNRMIFLNREFPEEERDMGANYSNKLDDDVVKFYQDAAMRRLSAEESKGPEESAEDFSVIFLFLCNKRRIHDGN